MYCMRCGHKLDDGMRFCYNCGQKVLAPVKMDEHVEKVSLPKVSKSLIARIIAAVCALALVIGLIVWNPFSLEKRLMGRKWWSEIYVDCEYFDYTDESGYWVDASCYSTVFCPYGTMREQYYYTPIVPGNAYMTSYEVTADNIPGWFEWGMGAAGRNYRYYNSDSWELLSGRRLALDEYVFEWSREESDDTWYLSGNTLRIGSSYYTSEDPGLNVIDDDVPYWCENCGEPGPYSRECPNCDSKKKVDD